MKEVFVFGSNLAGKHIAGAAKVAYKKHGARWGMGVGHYGCSYAIPSLGSDMQQLSSATLKVFIDAFLLYAAAHPEWDFKVTRIGCGIARRQDAFMAPFFEQATSNVQFDEAWKPFLPHPECYTYWGTY